MVAWANDLRIVSVQAVDSPFSTVDSCLRTTHPLLVPLIRGRFPGRKILRYTAVFSVEQLHLPVERWALAEVSFDGFGISPPG